LVCVSLTKLRQILRIAKTCWNMGSSSRNRVEFNLLGRIATGFLRSILSAVPLFWRSLMEGKIVVVTGASGALGRVVAASALAKGAKVAGIDHTASAIKPTADRIELGGVDLTDAPGASKAIDAAASHFGKIDALINIAGGFAFETTTEGDPKTWQRMYALNVLTALNASRSAIPYLAKSTAGRIVNVGAMGALQAGAGMGAYAASKAGVHRLTEALAAEWKGKITVNAVLPSIIDTAANRTSMPDADFSKWVKPEELAEVILFLASDAASAVTGALLPVNGRV
jgi:NAD(P)-dependent dehydrogenase (short-subunit alcohol dehydrogenase family)